MLEDIRKTLNWIIIVPFLIIVDICLYIIGIFDKEMRIRYLTKESLGVLEKILTAKKRGTND